LIRKHNPYRTLLPLLLIVVFIFLLASCGGRGEATGPQSTAPAATLPASGVPASTAGEPTAPEKNGEVYVLYTSDVHCGIDEGFGYVGLCQIRQALEEAGYTTLLVDNGDAVQGDAVGVLSRGEAIIDLMNALRYDAAIPGNHEFDYGTDQFRNLVGRANYPYLSCNLRYKGERVLDPYVLLDAAGLSIAFVGVTTPRTITSSTPAYFQDENGEFVYDFMGDETGEAVYGAVQNAVDAARADGADLVFVLGHLGFDEEDRPWTYADVIGHTSGIDVLLDGHSHDSEQVTVKDKDGRDVIRSACGTKLASVGYCKIGADGKILDTGVWTWSNDVSAPELLGIENDLTAPVADALRSVEEKLGAVVGRADYQLTIYDPTATDSAGKPIRIVRRAETNLGDLCADAVLNATRADIAVVGGGGIRTDIPVGPVRYRDLVAVDPFGNEICVIRATGQMILDALEWGVRTVPGEGGSFLQVAGLTYSIDTSVPSPVLADENGMMTGVGEGERRVFDVCVGGVPLDPAKEYTVGGANYTLLFNGSGLTAFDGAELVTVCVGLDYEILADFVKETLGGVIGERYADPYGDGRITAFDGKQ